MAEFIKFFKDLNKNSVGIAGGKGASLGEMTKAGIPVPPGFVVTADTFERFLTETDLHAEIQAQLDKVNHDDTNSVEGASVKIRAIIDATAIPNDLEQIFLESYQKLGSEFVAVRSSATAEDSKTASWAGELESYLFTTEKTLLENIKKCWSSLYTPRAIFYRFEKKLHDSKVSVAVVVQKMVNADISGIIFTVHPVTKDPNQLVVEAGWGLGESIVGGMITPDTYVVDKSEILNPKSEKVLLDIYESDQGFKIVFKPGGGTQEVKPAEHEKGRKLSDKKVVEIAKLAKQIENHYAMPMDIEFAIEKGKTFIVQARPITTL